VINAFADLVDAKRILREIKLMRFFNGHENLVSLCDMEEPPSPLHPSFTDIYLITALCETDLHRVIYSRQKLTEEHGACGRVPVVGEGWEGRGAP
jgi:mitogen-activated protein kinase 1/3